MGDDHFIPKLSSGVLLETNNPLDVTPEDLEELAILLEAIEPRPSIEIGYEHQYGSGVTGHEVLLFWIPNADALRDGLYVPLIIATVGWMKKLFKRKHREHRSKVLTVYDASTGEPLETWILRDAESEPIIETPDRIRRPLPTRRPRPKR